MYIYGWCFRLLFQQQKKIYMCTYSILLHPTLVWIRCLYCTAFVNAFRFHSSSIKRVRFQNETFNSKMRKCSFISYNNCDKIFLYFRLKLKWIRFNNDNMVSYTYTITYWSQPILWTFWNVVKKKLSWFLCLSILII